MVERRARRVRRVGMVPEPRGARERCVQRTEGGHLAERTAAAVALRAEVDDVGPEPPHVLVVEAPAADDPAAVVLRHHVGGGAEAPRQLAAALRPEVEADALLAAVLVVEGPGTIRRVGLDGDAPEEIEVGARLELHDVGAELSEHPAHFRHDCADPEVDDAHAGERRARGAAARRGRGARRESGSVVRAASGRRPRQDHRGAREVERRRRERRAADVWKPRRPEVAADARLLLGDELARPVDGRDRQAERPGLREDVGAGPRRERIGGEETDDVAVGEAEDRHLPLRPAECIGVADQREEGAPVPRGSGQHAHVAVGGRQHVIGAVGVPRWRGVHHRIEPGVVGSSRSAPLPGRTPRRCRPRRLACVRAAPRARRSRRRSRRCRARRGPAANTVAARGSRRRGAHPRPRTPAGPRVASHSAARTGRSPRSRHG